MSPDISRLFVGTFVPDQQREMLLKLQYSNPHLDKTWGLKLRWVKPEKLHMTWCFLGDVPRSLIDDAKTAMSKAITKYKGPSGTPESGDMTNPCAPCAPLWLRFNKSAFWPDAKNARVLVLEATAVPSQLLDLHDCITNELVPFSAYQEKVVLRSKFCPHITLVRLAPGANRQPLTHKKPLALDDITNLASLSDLSFPITEIALVESHLGSHSDAYEPLAVESLR